MRQHLDFFALVVNCVLDSSPDAILVDIIFPFGLFWYQIVASDIEMLA